MPDADLTAMSKTAAGIWKRCSLDVRKVGLSLVYHRIIINLRIQGVYSYLSIFDGLNIYTLYLTTLAPTTTKVDFYGGRPYK